MPEHVIYGAYFIYSYSGRRSIEHPPDIRNRLRKMNNKASKEKILLEKLESLHGKDLLLGEGRQMLLSDQ